MSDDPHQPTGAGPRFFAGVARFAVRFRYPVLISLLALSAFFLHQLRTNLLVDNSNEGFLDSSSEAAIQLEQLRDAFGRDEVFLVLIEGDVFSLPYLEKLKRLHGKLEAIDIPVASLGERKGDRDKKREMFRQGNDKEALAKASREADFGDFGDDEGWEASDHGGTVMDDVQSLVNARQTHGAGGMLRVTGLLDEWPTEADLPALKKRVLENRAMVNQVVSASGRYSVIVLRTAFMSEPDSARVYYEVERICDEYAGDGFEVLVAGMPAVLASLNRMMRSDMNRMAALASIVLLLAMGFVFRHPLGVVGPVFVVAQAAIWTLGSMAVMSVPMTIITSILAAFLQVVGIGDAVHILSVYRDARARGIANDEAIVYALSSTGMPVLFTTMTTAVGLLSFRFAGLQAVRDMGTFGALGVFYALLLSVLMIPALLSFNKKSLLGAKKAEGAGNTLAPAGADFIDNLMAGCNRLSATRLPDGSRTEVKRRRMLWVTAALGLATIAGGSLLTFHHDPLRMFPDGHPSRLASERMSEHLGGSSDMTFVIDALPGKDLRDRELMLGMEKLEQHIHAYQHPGRGEIVGSTASVLDVVRESWQALHEDDPKYYGVPDSERGVSDMFTMFESASPDQLRRLTTVDLKKTIMMIRVQWLAAEEYGPLTRHVLEGAEEFVDGLADIKLTGSAYSSFVVVERLVTDLVTSFGTALVVITFMMMFLLREVKLGLISMIPNLLPIALVMGFMGVAGIPIDLNNLLFGSIAIGIAVDDTIHFLHQFKVHQDAHGDVDDAIHHAFQHAGRAMVSTSVILVCGFMVMVASELSSSHMFAVLVSMSVVYALFSDLIIAPALLRTFYKPKA